jgi:hypothetical protein
MPGPTFPVNHVAIQQGLVTVISGITQTLVLMEEPETQGDPRPMGGPKAQPYVGIKVSIPAQKSGDDSKDYDSVTELWNSGGVRMMTVVFNTYGRTHEEAYQYGTLIQSSLDLEDVQQTLRELSTPIAVWTIGTVADASQLLNTGYEGRSRLEVTFGIASNLESDLGYIDSVEVQGTITLEDGTGTVDTDQTVTKP